MEQEAIKFFKDNGNKKVLIKKWWGSWELIPIFKDDKLIEVREGNIKYNYLMMPFFYIYSIPIGLYLAFRNFKLYRAKVRYASKFKNEVKNAEIKERKT